MYIGGMIKYIAPLLLLIVMVSCSDKELLMALEKKISNQVEQIDELKISVKQKNYELTANVKKISQLSKKVELLENVEQIEIISEEYDFNTVLIDNKRNLLPLGFIRTAGYITSRSIIETYKMDAGEMGIVTVSDQIYSGVMFFLTDRDNTLVEYLTTAVGNSYFVDDGNGNIGFPVKVDSLKSIYTSDPIDVLLTLHAFPEYSPESNSSIYFATVYPLK